jgi:phage/conjugal plasmid C-4 type zinc finger TraR family protein
VERFADTLDLAEASLNQTTEAAISTIRKQLTDGHGRTNCLDCGVKIPEKRLVYVPNAVRCADCQDLLERRRMLFGTDNSINTVATGDSEEPDDF